MSTVPDPRSAPTPAPHGQAQGSRPPTPPPGVQASAGRPPTMRDVATAAGVSKALVSLVFRDAPGASARTRERVFAAAEEIGYRTNRTASLLARRRSRLLGVSMVVANAFHAELVEAIQEAADDAGYQLVLSPVTRSHDEDRAVETLLEFRCEALLLLGPTVSDPELTALAGQLPVVVVGRPPGAPGPDVVRTDDADGLSQVVHHLVGLGHRRIAHVDGGPTAIAGLRVQGYTTAMTRCGLAGQIDILSGGHTEAAGLDAAEHLLARPPADRPTAVSTFNDHSATGLLDRLVRAGIDVPREISVVGYDDSALARLAHLDLTTVSQEPREQARLAVAAAVERLDGGRVGPRESVLPPRLVIRGTTAPPPMPSGGRS